MKRFLPLMAAVALWLWRALGRYQTWFFRPWRGDPGNHNYAVLSAGNLSDAVRTQMQPWFEYWLRAKVWLPLFGRNERAFRLPGVFYALTGIALAVTVAHRHFLRRNAGLWAAWASALFVGAWLSASDWMAWEATGGRHYTFVALASVAWFALAFLDLRAPDWLLAAAGLLFINTHFFALPLVLGYYALRPSKKNAKIAAGLILCTALINWPALSQLLFHFPLETQEARPLSQGSWAAIVLEGWRQFQIPALGLLAAAALVFCWKEKRSFLFYPLVLVPLEIAVIHGVSSYPFKERYHAVFLGQCLVLVVFGLEALFRWSAAWGPRGLAFASIVLGVLFAVPAGVAESVGVRLHVPPANFTDTWQAYREMAESGPETVFLHEQPKGDFRLARFYLAANGLAKPNLFATPSASEKDRFEKAFAGGKVVLDGLPRKSCSREIPPTPGISVRLLHEGERCVHVVEGATEFSDVARAALDVGFPFFPEVTSGQVSLLDLQR